MSTLKIIFLIVFLHLCAPLISQNMPGTITRTEIVRVPAGTPVTSANRGSNLRFRSLSEPKVGDEYYRIKTKDIHGNKIDTKDWSGKTIVLNYWFIACAPCRKEIPELNELVSEYKSDSSIAFLAIALDPKSDIREFISKTPFEYIILPEGYGLKGTNQIRSFPTNIIIDRSGKIRYYQSGYGPGSILRLKKSLQKLLSEQ